MAVDTTQAARKKITMAEAQKNLWSVNVARRFAEVDTKTMGTKYNPYTNYPAISNSTVTGPSYNISNYSADADSIEINVRADASEHINSYDWKSVSFDTIANRGAEFGAGIAKVIDAAVLAKPVGFSGVTQLGDGGVAGSTTPWTSSNTVIDDILTAGTQQLNLSDAHGKKKFLVVSPYEARDLQGYLMNTGGSQLGDQAIRSEMVDPFVGTTATGVDVYMSNNLRNTVVLGLATNPTAGDTLTINGVVITFEATLGSTPGNVHITSAVDITRANLVEFLTGTTYPGDTSEAEATDTGYVALSEADQAKLANIGLTATNDNTADTMTLTANGTLVVSETLTDGTDTWAAVSRYLVMGNYGSIFLGLPTQGMDYHEKEVSGKAGVELFMEQFYNSTIWTRKKPEVLTILVN